ncbi:tripartite tricarboxylate transporter TctB family protein [Thalassospira marina]|uniref:DUF1468 domain-containing protein n=1 Tax=Thalassospira marina TaxID=2048283 RepID=A0A2N3KN39_9PROT|nr:tripartite tricarboxylate transporter TctB family protein [Thalassospira marina]PKR51906.1 hypothetical protein COO20_17380 [Thalassospira marina]
MSAETENPAVVDAQASAATRARNELARLVSYLVFGGIAVFCAWRASSLPASRWEPLGAGSFPKLVFIVLAVLCLFAVLRSLVEIHRNGGMPEAVYAFGRWLRIRRVSFAIYGLLVVYLAVLPVLGFSLATFGFLLVTQLLIAGVTRKTVIQSIIAALVFSFGLNALFADVFNVFLPRGVLIAF